MRSPRDEYEARVADALRSLAQVKRSFDTISWVRVATVAAFLFAFGFARRWSLAPAALFVVAVLYHERIAKRIARIERVIAYYRLRLDRVDDKWDEPGQTG